MGATIQLSLYSKKEKKIVKTYSDPSVKSIGGKDILTNTQINFCASSILVTSVALFVSHFVS